MFTNSSLHVFWTIIIKLENGREAENVDEGEVEEKVGF
jgi:hypothetical protein